jgi:osmotically-inducible protein OsmY
MKKNLLTAVAASLVFCGLAGCAAPLLLGGAFAGGVLMATDRRTSGAQIEDEGIELRASNRVHDALVERAHVNITSYNRQVLLTGEVPTEQDKAAVEQIAIRVDNVKNVVNELAVLGNSTLTARSFKIVTERGTVYMMGRVTQREANLATEVVRGQSGVQKVVRLLEIISEEELKRLLPAPAPVQDVKFTPVLTGTGGTLNTISPK